MSSKYTLKYNLAKCNNYRSYHLFIKIKCVTSYYKKGVKCFFPQQPCSLTQTTSFIIIIIISTSLSPVTDLFCSLAEDLKMSESGSERRSASSTISLKSAESDRSRSTPPVFCSEPEHSQTRWECYCLTEWNWSLFDSFDHNLLFINHLWCQYQACWW